MHATLKTLCLPGLALLALCAAPARADDSCGGDLLAYKRAYDKDGNYVAQLEFYYNKGNGNNCAIFAHSDATWGKKLYTRVFINWCSDKQCTAVGSEGANNEDGGFYKYQAGPARYNPTANGHRCSVASGIIQLRQGDGLGQGPSAGASTAVFCY